MEKVISFFKNNLRQYAMVIALIAIAILFQILTDGILLKPLNITNLILQNSYILILAIGMVLVIITGNIDLSVGSVAAVIGAISAVLMIQKGMSLPVTILASLLIGALVGAWQGFWIAYVKIPSFIVTLAGMLIFRGLTMVILKGQTLAPFEKSYQVISSGFIPNIIGKSKFHLLTMVISVIISLIFIIYGIKDRENKKRYNFEIESSHSFIIKNIVLIVVINLFMYSLAVYKGIPNILILLATLIALYTFITNKTVVGRHIYALGGNEKASRLSGIKTKKVLFLTYVNMGILAALAGVVFAGRLNAATPQAGTNFELDAIAACFIGGASSSGGIGTVMGAIIGGLVMGILNNGMSIMGIGIDFQQTIKGLVLLLAVVFDVYTKNKASK